MASEIRAKCKSIIDVAHANDTMAAAAVIDKVSEIKTFSTAPEKTRGSAAFSGGPAASSAAVLQVLRW